MLPPVSAKSKLWDAALASLSPALQSAIAAQVGDHVDILKSVLKEAQLKREVCLNKRWRFKNSKGEVIILRDVMEKIIRWVDKFKAIGDIAVGFDQTQASLPWAAVRFLLVCASSDVKAFGTVLEIVEQATHLIAKYHEFERLYLQKASAIKSQLEAALIRLYTIILEALGSAVQAFDENTAHRFIKSPLRTTDDYIPKMKEQDDELMKLARMVDSELIGSLEAMCIRSIDHIRSYDRELERARYEKILSWLSTTNISGFHASMSGSRIENTGDWLFDHPSFEAWSRSSSSNMLLIHGVAGSGKTMLSSRVIDELILQRHDHRAAAPFAYFYCSASALEPERAQPENIMRHLLRQLAMSNESALVAHQSLDEEYSIRIGDARMAGVPENQAQRLSLNDCHRLLMDVTTCDPITIVIDAMDEISDDQRYKLIHILDQIVKDSANVVKVLITSRDDRQIIGLLDQYPKIRISVENNRADVKSFVSSQIEHAVRERRLLNGAVTPDLKEELQNFLLGGASEMFLWAKLQLESMLRMKHKQDILRTIRDGQRITLDELYAGIANNIFDAGFEARALAIRSFTWLIFAREALTPATFLAALNQGFEAEHSTLDDIESICYNLIVHDDDRVRFVHQSTQDFISNLDHFTVAKCHQSITEICLRSCLDGETNSSTDGELAFQKYCSTYWAEHYNLCRTSEDISNLDVLLDEFLFETVSEGVEPAFSFMVWHDSVRPIAESLPYYHPSYQDLDAVPNSNGSPFFLGCVYGMLPVVQRILSTSANFDINETNEAGQTGLYLACHTGNLAVAEYLLAHGADVLITAGAQGNALNAACASRYQAVVELLLSHSTVDWNPQIYARALEISSENLFEDIALPIVQHAIDKHIELDYDSAVLGASQAGFLTVVDALEKVISHKPNKDPSEEKYRKAIENGRVSMIRFMMQKLSHEFTNLPIDAVALAAQNGQTDTVTFLLDLGLDIEQEGRFGPPLRVAALMGHPNTVLKLIERGANVNMVSKYRTALYAAALKGSVHATRILIDHGASVHQEDFNAAVAGRHVAVAEILVASGTSFEPVTLRPIQWRYWCRVAPYLESKGLLDEDQNWSRRGGYN